MVGSHVCCVWAGACQSVWCAWFGTVFATVASNGTWVSRKWLSPIKGTLLDLGGIVSCRSNPILVMQVTLSKFHALNFKIGSTLQFWTLLKKIHDWRAKQAGTWKTDGGGDVGVVDKGKQVHQSKKKTTQYRAYLTSCDGFHRMRTR